jgi:hypothetical protein
MFAAVSKEKKPFPSNPKIVTRTYRGPDRRGRYPEDTSSGEVEFDDKGSPVWRLKTIRLRRKDDDTLNLKKALEVDSLSLEGDEPEPKPLKEAGYDPYSREE